MKYESSITYHSKAMANVKVFADKHTDRLTNGHTKDYVPYIYRCGCIKNETILIVAHNMGVWNFGRELSDLECIVLYWRKKHTEM